MELILQTLVNSAYAAGFLSLVAGGLVLISGVTGIFNFSLGKLAQLAEARLALDFA